MAGNKYNLTKRELEVLELVVKGYNNSAIAKELIIQDETAKAHVSSILRKLGAENRVIASVKAVKENLI